MIGAIARAASVLARRVIDCVGLRIGSCRPIAGTSSQDTTPTSLVQVERGTVHASDDAPSKQITVRLDTTMREMVALAMTERYVPGISGGVATWIIESSGGGADTGTALRPIAVYAEQWPKVKFLLPASASVKAHFGDARPRLNFRYRCQIDPDAVVASLQAAAR